MEARTAPSRRLLVLLTVAVVVAASCSSSDGEESFLDRLVSSTPTTEPEESGGPGARFEWSMAPRFGLDVNDDGRLDIPNTFEYVHNLEQGSCSGGCEPTDPMFTIELDASGSALDGARIDEYAWSIQGEGIGSAIELRSAESHTAVELPEGEFEVTLTVAGGGADETTTAPVIVEDILIVSLGDSYASGEGNPEIAGAPATWADDGASSTGTIQSLDHDGAHRSGLAGPAQAALEIERADPHTSVTFVFLPSSGATISGGVIGAREEVPVGSGDIIRLRPQLDEAAEILGCTTGGQCDRVVDVVMLSIGGNDAGFAFTLGSLIALDGLLLSDDAYAALLEGIMIAAELQLDALPGLFEELDRGLEVLHAERTFITAYPAPTRTVGASGIAVCEEIAGDLVFALEVDGVEIEQAETRVLLPLNARLEEAASAHGWTYVEAHVDEFQQHGYCGSEPYEAASYPGNPFPDLLQLVDDPGVRWFRQANESRAIQGGRGGQFRPEHLATTGTLHPNELGHQAYKRALLDAMGFG